MRLSRFRPITWAAVAVMTWVSSGRGEGAAFVLPTRDGVGAYLALREIGKSEPVHTFSTSDRLRVVQRERKALKVQDQRGRELWVSSKDVAATPDRSFTFDGAHVTGWLDNPGPIYILDADAPSKDMIRIDRSFSDLLREHKDRQVFERRDGVGPHRAELL